MVKIPIFSNSSEYKKIQKEVEKSVLNVLRGGKYSPGRLCKEFEEKFAAYCDSKYCSLTSSGTVALQLSIEALKLKYKNILTTPISFIASTNSITINNSLPIFEDVDNNSNLCSVQAEKRVKDSKNLPGEIHGLLPVGLYGNPPSLIELQRISKENDIPLIVDSCQCVAAEINNKSICNWGDIHCFSYYSTKNLSTITEAGSIVTNNEELYKEIVSLKDHGRNSIMYQHYRVGINGRSSEIAAAVLLIKLKYLDEWTNNRIAIAKRYDNNLRELIDNGDIAVLAPGKNVKCVYHLYPVWLNYRIKGLMGLVEKELNKYGISFNHHYPVIPDRECYRHLSPGGLVNARGLAQSVITIPMYMGLKNPEIDYVSEKLINAIKSFH